MDPLLVFMGLADVAGGLFLLSMGGLAELVAYVLLFKGGASLLSTPW
jgi:hypothetical protein